MSNPDAIPPDATDGQVAIDALKRIAFGRSVFTDRYLPRWQLITIARDALNAMGQGWRVEK